MLTYVCRAGNPTKTCLPLQIRDRVLGNHDLSTRLRFRNDGNQTGFEIPGTSGAIKGLFISRPAIDNPNDCYWFNSRPGLVVFKVPREGDPQHVDIAKALSIDPDKSREALSVGGFVLKPLPAGYIQENVIDLNPATDYDYIANDFNAKNRVGYVFNSLGELSFGWTIYAYSGHFGKIPAERLPIFLASLARAVSPHFSVFQVLALPEGKALLGFVPVPLRQVYQPTCLVWPKEETLLRQLMEEGDPILPRYSACRFYPKRLDKLQTNI